MSSKRKRTKQNVSASNSKTTKQIESPISFYDRNPVWSFTRCDFEHERWGFCNCHERLEDFKNMILHLRDLERQFWKEILTSTSGNKRHTRNHDISVEDLIPEARARWEQLHYNEWSDSPYSLRTNGSERVWGIIDAGVFYIIWIDKAHEICPSLLRHT